MAEYLSLSQDEIDNQVPYILALNKNNEMRMLAVSRALVHACRDRLNFWHSLQEMAGVRNRYVELAEQRIQSDAEMAIAQQVAQAKAEFDAELERARTEAAAEVMTRLTDMLLGMDLSSGDTGFRPAAAVSTRQTATTEAVEDVAEAEAIEEEEQESFSEPWIDSPLCTTCNDCTDMNPLMFVYDESNQAYIADLSAGTYKQMVEAAEICPSKCIHPGVPWDNSEADLDDLVARAKPFN